MPDSEGPTSTSVPVKPLPKRNWLGRAIKRSFDIGFVLLALPVCLPLALIAALAVRLSGPGPVFYVTERVGLKGKRFRMFKFRSMVREAGQVGPSLTHKRDPRLTRIGRILRRTKFDEFPQVMNVIRGEMSIVGPRPPLPQHAALLTPEQSIVLEVRPGLTSLAQVAHRDEEDLLPAENTEEYYLDVILPRKNRSDLAYVRNWSLSLDFKVFLVGLAALFRLQAELGLDRFTEPETDLGRSGATSG